MADYTWLQIVYPPLKVRLHRHLLKLDCNLLSTTEYGKGDIVQFQGEVACDLATSTFMLLEARITML